MLLYSPGCVSDVKVKFCLLSLLIGTVERNSVGTKAAATEVARLLYGANIANCIIPDLYKYNF